VADESFDLYFVVLRIFLSSSISKLGIMSSIGT
jgi:hypothetical protein